MQKLKKKYMRENFIKDKLAALLKEKIKAHKLEDVTIQHVEDILKLQTSYHQARRRTKTESN